MKKWLMLFVVFFIMNVYAQSTGYFFEPIDSTIIIYEEPEDFVVRRANLIKPPSLYYNSDHQIIVDTMSEINVKLFDGLELTVHKKQVEFNNNGYLWYGSTSNQSINVYFSVRNNGTLSGRLELGQYHYRILIDESGTEMSEIDTTDYVSGENSSDSLISVFSNSDNYDINEQYEINILVAAGPLFLKSLGGSFNSKSVTEEQIKNYFDELLMKVNGAFLNTGINNVKVNFPHIEFLNYHNLSENSNVDIDHGYVNSTISTIMDKQNKNWINSYSRSDEDWILGYVNQYTITTERGNSAYADVYRYFLEGSAIPDVSERGAIANCNEERADWCTDNDEDNVCDYRTSIIKSFCGNPNHKLRQNQGYDHPNNSGNRYIIDNGSSDNCPGVYNPIKANINPYQELISARKDDEGFSGAALLGYGYYSADRKYFFWQPDHDLDGLGDACDLWVFSINGGYGDGVTYSRINDVKGFSKGKKLPDGTTMPSWFSPANQYAKIGITMPEYSGMNPDMCPDGFCKTAIHYCAISYQEMISGYWGKDGYCTTTEKTNNPTYFNTQHEFTCNFGFSHGSDDYTEESIARWERRITNLNVGLTHDDGDHTTAWSRKPVDLKGFWTTYYNWNWRRDWYVENGCNISGFENLPVCVSLRTATEKNEEFSMYYAVSTSIVNPEETYKISGDGRDIINTSYFRSKNKYSRSYRYGVGGDNTAIMELNYHLRESPIEIQPDLDLIEIEYCPSCYWNIPLGFIYGTDGLPIPEAVESIGRWSFVKTGADYSFNSQQLYFPANAKMIGETQGENMYAVTMKSADASTEYKLRFNTGASGADWNSIGIISNWNNNVQSVKTASEKDDVLYFISKKGLANNLYYLFRLNLINPSQPGDYVCDQPLPTYSLEEIGLLGINEDGLDSWNMISTGEELYIIAAQFSDDSTKMFKLNSNDVFEEITGSNPPASYILNTGLAGKYIFLTGGLNHNKAPMSDLWRFNTETEIWEQIPVTLQGDFRKVITQVVDGKLVMANPVIDGNTTHPAFEIDPNIEDINDLAGNLNYIVIPVTEVEYIEGDDYCLYNDGTFILGGRAQGGTCTPFTVPQYDTYSVGSTVYTLSGSGTKLAVGTGSDVKIYDITDPLNPVLEHTQNIYGPASDILIRNNKLIVAVENGIDTIDMSDYSYSHTATYGTTKALEIYNEKLYVGDGQGIKIFDPDTLTLIQQLNTSGDVSSLEIIDNTVYSFEWAGLKRYDSETLDEIQTNSCYIYEPETFVYDDSLYIYKNNSIVELSFNGSTVTETSYVGDEVDLRNHYSYGNYTYFPAGTNVRISTIEENPAAICGNGVVETGEVCDENSVACTTLSSDYDSGTAYCNSNCDGYNEDNCEGDDGW